MLKEMLHLERFWFLFWRFAPLYVIPINLHRTPSRHSLPHGHTLTILFPLPPSRPHLSTLSHPIPTPSLTATLYTTEESKNGDNGTLNNFVYFFLR